MPEGHPWGTAPAAPRRAAPAAGADLVERPRLVEMLRRPSRVSLVIAPPGFGKSTVVAQWAASCPDPLAWLAVDLLDDAPATFWSRVIDAVRSVVPCVDDEPRQALDDDPTGNRFLSVLIAQLEQAAARAVLVLDSVPAEVARAVTDGLALITERVGERLQLVITARVDPPLPLARWRTRGWVTELREVDLRFTDAEALEVAATFGELRLPDDVVRGLNERADGWPIALHLALVSAREDDDPAVWLRSLTASPSVLGDFVVTEILDNLPLDEREVVFDLSVVDWFDVELALELAGERAGPALVELRRRRLLLTEVNGETPGMRFHPLLRTLVAAELRWRDRERYVALQRRAAELCRRRGMVTAAYRHLVDIGDVEASNDLVITSLIGSRDRDVAAWSAAAAAALDDPDLAVDLAFAAFINRDPRLTHAWIARADDLVQRQERPSTSLRLRSVQALLALMEGRLSDAAVASAAFEAVLPDAPDSDGVLRRFANVAARIALQDGRPDDAAPWRDHLPLRTSSSADRLTSPMLHAWCAVLRGRPRAARAVIEPVCQWAERSGLRHHHVAVDAHVTAARVNIALGDLTVAHERAMTAWSDAARLGWVWHRVRVLTVVATVTLLRDGPADAIALIDEGAVDLDRSVELLEELDLVAATAWHHAGDLARAAAVLAALGDHPPVRVMRASVDLEADRAAEAIAVLEGSETWAGESLVQARTLLAIATGRTSTLRTVVADAALAGWVGPFLMLGPRTRDHLRALPLAELHPALAVHLVAAGPARPVAELVEALTARESSILELLPTHLSYRQIAEQLGLSVNTVKSNLKAIYRKLAVTTRSEAVLRGRGAGLV